MRLAHTKSVVWRASAIGFAWIVSLWLVLAPLVSSSAQPSNVPFRPGAILVGLPPGASPATVAQLFTTYDLHIEQTIKPLSILSVHVPIGREQAVADSLRRSGQVAFAELDYAAHATDLITPTDPGWANQWGPRKIEAPAAWTLVTGTANVIIAVVDSGITLAHEDLASQRWLNAGEIPGNWIDDDGNGYVDDVNGWHFFHRYTAAGYVPDENADVQDDYGHGTHVAGIAVAAASNGVGVTGIAPGAQVMPIKVLDKYGNGWYSDIAAGIVYAVDNGARIINLSLGGEIDSAVLREPIEYAQAHNVLIVAATGNTNSSVLYPAAYPNVLAVAATDQSDQRAAFSNFGPEVDVAAPGVDIYSTWPWVTGYFTKSGTSMATPHVSGAAALVWSYWPGLTADQVANDITQTATDVGSIGWDVFTGWGRIDVFRAVERATPLRLRLPLVLK
jgi:subtilisin family serine protease